MLISLFRWSQNAVIDAEIHPKQVESLNTAKSGSSFVDWYLEPDVLSPIRAFSGKKPTLRPRL